LTELLHLIDLQQLSLLIFQATNLSLGNKGTKECGIGGSQMAITVEEIKAAFGTDLPMLMLDLNEGSDIYVALAAGLEALKSGSLSWARLNQIIHRCSEAGMSEGCFRYYFLEVPLSHPYAVERVVSSTSYTPPPNLTEIKSLPHAQWGIRRFIFDAMLYWGNLRQAYRELRQLTFDQTVSLFAGKRVNDQRMLTRGKVAEPTPIPRDSRYLISEMACKTYEAKGPLRDSDHVRLALEGFRALRAAGAEVTPISLRAKTKEIAEGRKQQQLFDLMFEDAPNVLQSEEEVVALYDGQWAAFEKARVDALQNTRVTLLAILCLGIQHLALASTSVHPVKLLHGIPELLLNLRVQIFESLSRCRLMGFDHRPHIGTPHFSYYRRRSVYQVGTV
jgi:hypothetical protein